MKSKQPIYVVARLDVLEVIRHQSLFCQIPYRLDWGNVTSEQELVDAINALPRYPDDTINMSRLAQCVHSFDSNKLLGGANRMLIRIWEIIKTKRKIYESHTE